MTPEPLSEEPMTEEELMLLQRLASEEPVSLTRDGMVVTKLAYAGPAVMRAVAEIRRLRAFVELSKSYTWTR